MVMAVAERFTRISITSALIINIAALTIVVGALCAWFVTALGTRYIHHQESVRLAEMGRHIAGAISHAMQEREAEVRGIRDLFENELASSSDSQKREVMNRARSARQHFSWMGVVGTDGLIALGTEGLLEGSSVAGRNWFEGAKHSSIFFGNVHPASLLADHIRNEDGAPLYLLDIALPLRSKDGEVAAVLGSHFNWKMIEEVVTRVVGTSAGAGHLSAAVVSGNGDILYDTQRTEGNVETVLSKLTEVNLTEGLWLSDTGTYLMSSTQVPSHDSFDGLGWHIVVREPVEIVGSEISSMKWQVIGISLIVGLLFSCLGIFVVRPIVRPLKRLVADLDHFGETEVLPAPRQISAVTEIAELNGSFLLMAARVSAHGEVLRDTQVEIVRALGRAGEFRDNETGGHVIRMSTCCRCLAELSGKSAQEAEMLGLASQMHDIGKIGIPDHILLKPGKYDANERAVMERHCEIGARILTGVDTPLTAMARTIALTHHEKWDGSGYPKRLVGEEIPFEGRVTAICDVFDALLSSRPYKQAWPIDRVIELFEEQSGRHFDPTLIRLFLEHLDEFVALRQKISD